MCHIGTLSFRHALYHGTAVGEQRNPVPLEEVRHVRAGHGVLVLGAQHHAVCHRHTRGANLGAAGPRDERFEGGVGVPCERNCGGGGGGSSSSWPRSA